MSEPLVMCESCGGDTRECYGCGIPICGACEDGYGLCMDCNSQDVTADDFNEEESE